MRRLSGHVAFLPPQRVLHVAKLIQSNCLEPFGEVAQVVERHRWRVSAGRGELSERAERLGVGLLQHVIRVETVPEVVRQRCRHGRAERNVAAEDQTLQRIRIAR